MVQKFPIYKKLDPNNPCYNNLEPVYIGSRDGNHKFLQTNVEFHKPKINGNQVTGQDVVNKFPIEELNPITKELGQLEMQFDIFKDEWTLEELLHLNITEIPFLVEKLIPKDTLVVLAGQSEIGKSTLYTQLAIAIVRGDNEFLECKLNAIHKRVLVISTEDGPIPLSFRTNKQVNQATVRVEKRRNLDFIFNYNNLEERIEKYLEKNKVDLIVIDAFGDVFWGDINATNSVRNFLNRYVKFIQEFGCSVLFVHHVCKGKNKQRQEKDQLLGSTGIEGKMRNVLMLSIVNDQHQLSIVKGNYVSREDKQSPIYLNFDDKTLTFSRAEGPAQPKETDQSDMASGPVSRRESKPGRKRDEQKRAEAFKLYKEGVQQVEIANRLEVDKSTICKWIKAYKEATFYDPSKVDVD
jgi:RecA-family ATPase